MKFYYNFATFEMGPPSMLTSLFQNETRWKTFHKYIRNVYPLAALLNALRSSLNNWKGHTQTQHLQCKPFIEYIGKIHLPDAKEKNGNNFSYEIFAWKAL